MTASAPMREEPDKRFIGAPVAPTLSDGGTTVASSDSVARVVRAFGFLAAGSLANQIIAFAALVYVARRVGVANLGAYTFAAALISYLGLFSSLGIDILATRDMAQRTRDAKAILLETLALQLTFGIVLYGAVLLAASWLVHDTIAAGLVPIVGLALLTSAFTLDWALLALGQAPSVAVWRLVGQVLYGVLVPFEIVRGKSGVFAYAWLNLLGLAVTSAGLTWWAWRAVRRASSPEGASAATGLALPFATHLLRRLKRSAPFAYSLAMIQVYAGAAPLMLGYFASTRDVGIFAVANKLPLGLTVFTNLWLTAIFPHTARRLREAPRQLLDDLGTVVAATIVIGAAISLAAWLCGPSLIPALFGASFHDAVRPFALLAVAAAIIMVDVNFANVLLAGGGQRYFATLMTVAAVAMIALDVILIPRYGTLGATVAILSTQIVVAAANVAGVVRRLGPIPLNSRRLLRGAGAVAAMAVATTAARAVGGGLFPAAIAAVSFVVASIIFRAFDPRLVF